MAKLECAMRGNMDEILKTLEDAVLRSISASCEDSSDFRFRDGIRCAVRVYERYSFLGKNRVSLSLTLVGTNEGSRLSVITSGGSQAVFFKLNTWGEESFLDTIRDAAAKYKV